MDEIWGLFKGEKPKPKPKEEKKIIYRDWCTMERAKELTEMGFTLKNNEKESLYNGKNMRAYYLDVLEASDDWGRWCKEYERGDTSKDCKQNQDKAMVIFQEGMKILDKFGYNFATRPCLSL